MARSIRRARAFEFFIGRLCLREEVSLVRAADGAGRPSKWLSPEALLKESLYLGSTSDRDGKTPVLGIERISLASSEGEDRSCDKRRTRFQCVPLRLATSCGS